MTQSFEVKRVEAQTLLSELKGFAFEQSPGFRNGTHVGMEVIRNFHLIDPVPPTLRDRIAPEMCKSTFGFTAYRTHLIRNKLGYAYVLSTGVERTLSVIPPHILPHLDPDIVEAYDDFVDLDEGVLCEEMNIELETSDHELREISSTQRYTLTYAGDELYEATDDDILYGNIGEFVHIPTIESDDFAEQLFIAESIEHESLDSVDRLITGIGFLAIVEPLTVAEQVDTYRANAARMRAIMQILRTGIVE